MISVGDIVDGWRLLETIDIPPGHLATRDAGILDVQLGMDGAGGRHVLFPAPGEVRAPAAVGAITIAVRPLAGGRFADRFLDVSCGNPTLESSFGALVAEVLAAAAARPSAAAQTCVNMIEEWRVLFDEIGPADVRNIRGLLGELHVLHQLVARNTEALGHWTGPRRSHHDFVHCNQAIEVKTADPESHVVSINGVGQLDVPEGSSLHLWVVGLRRSERGVSVSDLVRAILDQGVDRLRLLHLVGAVLHNPLSSSERYEVLSDRIYAVDADFPRITPGAFAIGSVPAGVTAVRYWIDLGGRQPLEERAVGHLLQEFAA